VYAYRRHAPGDDLIVAINFSADRYVVEDFGAAPVVDLLTAEMFPAPRVAFDPWQARILAPRGA
jgi:hypothetical protein